MLSQNGPRSDSDVPYAMEWTPPGRHQCAKVAGLDLPLRRGASTPSLTALLCAFLPWLAVLRGGMRATSLRAAFQSCQFVVRQVGGFGLAHAARLKGWTREVNPSSDLCNKAFEIGSGQNPRASPPIKSTPVAASSRRRSGSSVQGGRGSGGLLSRRSGWPGCGLPLQAPALA